MTDELTGAIKSNSLRLAAIVAAAFIFRVALLSLVHNPGLHDPVHYFNLGRRLAQGQGFTIDYVWHYSRMPVELVHATDHWMPLAGFAAAIGIAAGSEDVQAAVAVFVLAGAVIPLLTFWASKQLDQDDRCALMAAMFSAFLPDLVLNSLRTDTTILNAVLVCSAVLLLIQGLLTRRRLQFILCGILIGLAYLTRSDSIIFLPMLVLFLPIGLTFGPKGALKSGALLIYVVFIATVSPWLLRNVLTIGMLGSPEISRMPFMIEPKDLYAFDLPITLESMFARRSVLELAGKRLFELAAAVKQVIVSLDFPLIFFVPIGVATLILKGDRRRIMKASPALIWTICILVIYPILMPVHSQGGSFKKAFLTIVPLLVPLGVIGIYKLIRHTLARRALIFVSMLWLLWSCYALVSRDTAKANTFYDTMEFTLDALESLPDSTGDGEIRLMSQYPFELSYFGHASVVIPLTSRENTLKLARQFDIDYLLMPAARPALDALYLGVETDPRFVLAAHLADAGEIPFELYRLVYDS